MSWDADDYTPYGYLATPEHARNLRPRGVLRSWDAGVRWHFPALAGGYGGRQETYRAGLRAGLEGALALGDYARVSSPYHTSGVLAFELESGAGVLAARYHAAGEHALRALVRGTGAGRVTVHAEYARRLSATGQWGESGLVGRVAGGAAVLQAFEDGEAFVLWASRPAGVRIATSAEQAPGARELGPGEFVTAVGRGDVALHAVLSFAADGEDVEVVLARGPTLAAAFAALDAARRDGEAEHARLLAADAAFWARAPRLTGDWPAHWRRGVVYDLETVRMMVKPPLGIYAHVWDAMQVQAPRAVLAEAALDALLLGYGDPALARELIAGTFLDAPAPNVPCSREDGTLNMVAADGSECGTAPPWGYPFVVVEWLAALGPGEGVGGADGGTGTARRAPTWVERIYPALAAYLDWWLANRRDAAGWLVYACSWESGQDDSPRFGPQPLGGGQPVRHVRPVDLQAAFAHGCRVQARLAGQLGRAAEQARWQALAGEFAARTHQLWNGARYADYDTRAGGLTGVDDVMLLAPAALGVARPECVAALRGAIAAVGAETLTWPVPAWTAIAAAQAAGLGEKATDLAAALCERAYGFWDARPADPARTLPGVACEYWPPDGRCGAEAYGWGGMATHFLLDALVGLAPDGAGGWTLRPSLPRDWRVAGRRYAVRLTWQGRDVELALEPRSDGRVDVSASGATRTAAWGEELRL